MNKQTTKMLLIIGTVLISLILWITIIINTTNPGGISESEAKEWMIEGCIEEIGSSYITYCTCAADYMVDEYGVSKVVEMGLDTDSAITEAAMDKAVDYCIDKLF